MMGEHLLELDPEEELVDAFSCFDEGDKGVVDVKEMRKFLGELGDRMDDWEVSYLNLAIAKFRLASGLGNAKRDEDADV